MRSLLIWLLVLALPAQGAAVAAMIGCGPKHHAAAASSAGPASATDGHAHGGMQAAGPHHQHATAPLAGDAVDALASASPAPHAGPAGSDDSHKCSVCASCCSAGAILNSVPMVPSPEIAPVVFAVVVATVDPFAVDGPDRPPRSVLA